MKQYVDLLFKILTTGEKREDRTGVGTLSVFGGQVEFDLQERFPLVTIKETRWKIAFLEMLWFLRGESNTKFLKENGSSLWDPWADKDGNLGPIYGVQWRKWPGKLKEHLTRVVTEDALNTPSENFDYTKYGTFVGSRYDTDQHEDISIYQESVDQIKVLLELIKTQPRGRRHIVTAWNPAFLKDMGLPPCHRDFHCYVSNDGHLDLMMGIRSWDTVLGGPFNIAQYALFTHLIARATDLKPRRLIITYGDAHIYLNHVDLIWKIINEKIPIRDERWIKTELIFKTDNRDIDGYKIEDFDILGYKSHPFMKFPIAV
jgi:thymidylate synthase